MDTNNLNTDINLLLDNVSLLVPDDPIPKALANVSTKSGILFGWAESSKLSNLQLGVLIQLMNTTDEERIVGESIEIIRKQDSNIAAAICCSLAFHKEPYIREFALEYLNEEDKETALSLAPLLLGDEKDFIVDLAKEILKS